MEYETQTIRFKKKTFKVEIADSFFKIAKGLMDHKSIPKNGGMLFIFSSEGRHSFWMLNMKFKIDIIWLDYQGRVVHVWKEAEPCKSIFSCRTEKPTKDSRYVVELRAGTADQIGLKLGDKFML